MRCVRWLGLALVALALAGCSGQLTFTIDFNHQVLQASGSGSLPRSTLSLAPGASMTVEVWIPAHLRSNNLRFTAELDAGGSTALDLFWIQPGVLTPIASTSGPAFFAPGWSGVGSGTYVASLGAAGETLAAHETANGDVTPAGVVVAGACRGPCFSTHAGEARLFLRVRNRAPYPVSAELYAFVGAFQDSGEPHNSSVYSPTPVTAFGFASGALETLGDRDHFHFPHVGWAHVRLLERAGFNSNLRVGVVDALTNAITETPVRAGGTFLLYGPATLVVYSSTAAPRASSHGTYWIGYP